MRREVAEEIVGILKRSDALLGELETAVRKIEDEQQRKKALRALAETILRLYEDIARDVTKEYPDLHPDKDYL
jgi:hypothetical protein